MSVTGLSTPHQEMDGFPGAPWSRRKKLFVSAGVLLVLFAVAYNYVAAYQPVLEQLGAPSGVWTLTQVAPGSYVTQAADGSRGFDSPRPGFSFVVGQTIAVRGPFAIKVTNAVSTFWTAPYHEVAYKVADQRPVFRTGGQFVPLKSVTVKGNVWTSPMFGVQFTVPKCANKMRNYPVGTTIQTMGIRLTYTFLWFTHTVDIPTQSPATIVNPFDCGIRVKSIANP